MLCDQEVGRCVHCLQHADCDSSLFCSEGSCILDTCPSETTLCQGNAVAQCNEAGNGVASVGRCVGEESCVRRGGTAQCLVNGACGDRDVDVIWVMRTGNTFGLEPVLYGQVIADVDASLRQAGVSTNTVLLASARSRCGDICVLEPLASPNCADSSSFTHFDVSYLPPETVESLLRTYNGWKSSLRPSAVKVIVVVNNLDSDDSLPGDLPAALAALDPPIVDPAFVFITCTNTSSCPDSLIGDCAPGGLARCWPGPATKYLALADQFDTTYLDFCTTTPENAAPQVARAIASRAVPPGCPPNGQSVP